MSFWKDSPSSKRKVQMSSLIITQNYFRCTATARLGAWLPWCAAKDRILCQSPPFGWVQTSDTKKYSVIWQLQRELLTCRFLKILKRKCYMISCLRLKINVVALISPYLYDVSTKMIRKAKPKLQLQQASVDLCSWIHPFRKTCGFAGACQHYTDSPIFQKITAKCERTQKTSSFGGECGFTAHSWHTHGHIFTCQYYSWRCFFCMAQTSPNHCRLFVSQPKSCLCCPRCVSVLAWKAVSWCVAPARVETGGEIAEFQSDFSRNMGRV